MILALLLMVAMPMMAERVSPETARKVATTFLNNNGAKSTQLTDLSKAAGFANLYIFNGEEGFVVMAADDCVRPILGYSLTGKFIAENMPTNVSGWLQGYNDEIQYAIDSKMKATSETVKMWKDLTAGNSKAAKTTVVVDNLLATTWDQDPYYNDMCPYDSQAGERTVTGCVATAMAQIMKYWEYPTRGTGSHSYEHSTYGVQSANFGNTTYNWSAMPNSINSANTEIAQLMYHCGVSVNMDYGISATGGSAAVTANVANALKNYFGYQQSTFKYKSNNESSWVSMLKTELNNGRPLQYSGRGSGGGHSFVCCGYDSNDNFYFNWGWSGNNDGFYTLTNLVPGSGGSGGGSYSFTQNQGAIFGIQPNYNNLYSPSNLTAELVQSNGVRNVNLTWAAATNANVYKVYRNNRIIGTVSSPTLSFTDIHIPYGSNTYYVRSMDVNGNLSESSNSETITISFPAPSNLSAQLTNNAVVLAWDGVGQAVSYNVYCNNVIIDNVNDISYTHNDPPYGDLSYYVKGVDDLEDESEASNTCFVTHNFYGPIVTDLNAVVNNNNIQLSWAALVSESATLQHIDPNNYNQLSSTSYYSSTIGDTYWGVRFPASKLGNYAGMAINSIMFYVAEAGTYTVNVYQCTGSVPSGNPIYSTNNLSLSNWSRKQLSFTPQYLDYTKDLWIIINTSGVQFAACGTPEISIDEGNYMSLDGSSWMHTSHTWFISAGITDGTYTYNLYRNGEAIATAMSGTTYTDPNRNNAANYYTVTTNYFGGESAASNGVGLTLGTASLSSLELGENDQMTITEGSKLTVSGTLTNTNPANLILENGAELVHNSASVKTTVKKTVTPPSADDYGWYFIASPVTETVTPTAENGFLNGAYDLYYYNEPTYYWMNYEYSPFDINHQKGYLYANETTDGTTLQFAGTLTPSNNSVTINNLSHSASSLNGFNLVGNPFACNATVGEDFYVVNNTTGKVILASNTAEIAPCAGIFVKATENDASVTFTKATSSVEPSSSSFDIVVKRAAQPTKDGVPTGSTTLDRARVHLSDAEALEKFSIGDGEGSVIYFPQNGQDLAVACANGQNEMPLNFKAAKNGTYTLAFEVENLDLDYLHLIDNMTGEEVDVLAMPTYTFEAKTSDYASRFRLVFAENETEGASTGSAAFAYITDGEIIINVADACDASLQVVDMTGRVVLTGDAMNRVSTNGMTAGVYVLRLINGEQVKTQKIVVR